MTKKVNWDELCECNHARTWHKSKHGMLTCEMCVCDAFKAKKPVLIMKKADADTFEESIKKHALVIASTLLVAIILAAVGLLTVVALIWMGVL